MFFQKKLSIKGNRGKKFSINLLEKNGFFILENCFSIEDVKKLSDIRKLLIDESKKQKKIISQLTGYELGNLNIEKSFIHEQIWDLMMKSQIIKKTFQSFNVNKIHEIRSFGGNINFPNSIPQAFHRDSSLEKKYLLIFISLEKISSRNGSQEVISEYKLNGKNFIDMLITRFNYGSNLVDMNPGDILFRYSSTWHRGTRNNSEYPRPIPLFSIDLNKEKSKKIQKTIKFKKKISFKGNYAPQGIFGKIYVFLACKFNRPFHIIIYFSKLFKSQ